MDQTTKRFYRIREVAELLDIPQSTLRYWESEFTQLKPQRTTAGRRQYSDRDLQVCVRIKDLLYNKGLKIEAAKEYLDVSYRICPPRHEFSCKTSSDALRLLDETSKIVEDNAHAVARINAVGKWIEGSAKPQG